jgi:hypothetical protein
MSNTTENPFQSPKTPSMNVGQAGRNDSSDLSTGDWLLIIFCSGIACIIGIFRLLQGKPNGGKMVGFSLIFAFLWAILRVLLEVGMQGGVR